MLNRMLTSWSLLFFGMTSSTGLALGAVCGDGLVAGTEECDDGGDGEYHCR